jgi:hypothetical protein
MAVFLDDEPVTLPGEALGAVVEAAQTQLGPAGRIVVEVQLDGRTLPADDLAAHAATAVTESEVRLYSADPRELAADALDQVRGRLAQVRDDQEAAADLLQQDRVTEAMQTVGRCIEGWLQTQQTVQLAGSLAKVDLAAVRVDDQPITDAMNGLIEALKSLRDALVNRDTVALSDTLSYEWPAHVDAWDRLIEALIDHIEPD